MIVCRICGAESERRPRWNGLQFVQCPTCGVLFLDPQPSDEELSERYDLYYYPSRDSARRPSVYSNTPRAVTDQIVRCLHYHVLHQVSAGSVLDYGCGVGDFMATAARFGLNPIGIEFNYEARKEARARGLVVHETLEELIGCEPTRRFDLIALLDVVEHVRDPRALLRQLRELLSRKGAVYLSAPNRLALKAVLLGNRWEEANNPTHLYLYSPSSIKRLLAEAGYVFRWLPCRIGDPARTPLRRAASHMAQRLRINSTLRVVARSHSRPDMSSGATPR